MVKRALYIGRFQPFHNGHASVIKTICKELGEGNELIIGIGSAQESHTLNNPFTAGERILMVQNGMDDIWPHGRIPFELPDGYFHHEEIEKLNYYVVPIEDVERNVLWVAHVESMVPPFDIVYTNNPLVSRLFSEKSYEIRKTAMFSRESFSGSRIRQLIIDNNYAWEGFLPAGVGKTIRELDGINRIKTIAAKDE